MLRIQNTALILALLAVTQVSAQTVDDLTFGPQTESRGKVLDNIAAVVGTDVITRKELQRAGGKNDNAVLERLIIEKLLLQAAKRRNIIVGDTALNIAMQQQRSSKGKRLSREALRKQLLIQKLQQQVAGSLVSISDQEIATIVDKQLKVVSDSVRLVDILVRIPESSDSEILQQAQNKTQEILARLKTQSGEMVASSYADVTYNDLGWIPLAEIPTAFSKVLLDAPTNEYLTPIIDRDGIHILKILARESATQAKGVGVMETRVSHILIRDTNNPNAKATINTLYQRLKRGEKFSDLAQRYSQDTGSAANGGALGWAVPGQMVPDFEAVMNNTRDGTISQPFKSPFGYHILTVHERRQASKSSREALEQQARQAIFRKKASEEWDLWVSRLRDEAHIDIR